VAIGPDGAYYVGELTGVPFATGAANVYRVVPGSAPTVALTGFTTVIDLAFASNGDLYVLEHSSAGPFFAGAGRLTRVTSGGARTVVVSNLNRPTAVLVDADGTIYISNKGTSVATGEVLKVQL
jgi:sugar lactone lactonase YvrE